MAALDLPEAVLWALDILSCKDMPRHVSLHQVRGTSFLQLRPLWDQSIANRLSSSAYETLAFQTKVKKTLAKNTHCHCDTA